MISLWTKLYKAHENKEQVQSCYGYFSSDKEENSPHSGLLDQFSDVVWWEIGWQMDFLFIWLCLKQKETFYGI